MIPERFIRPLVIGLIVVLAFLAWYIPHHRGQAAQNRVNAGQSQAGADTGSAAMNEFENMIGNAAETDRTVSEGSAAIHAAPEADKGRVAVQQACRLKANRNKPQCQGAAR